MAKGGVLGGLSKESALMTSLGILALRVTFGGTMLFAHGLSKLTGFAEKSGQFPDPLGVGSEVSLALTVGAEVFAAGAVALGLFTRLAALPLIICMAVAFLVIHGADPWQKRELAFVYMMAYVALFFTGGGRFSLDTLVFGNKLK